MNALSGQALPTWLAVALAFAPMAAAAFTATAALAAWRNVRNSRRAAHASVLLAMLKDYREDEIRVAMRHLRGFEQGSTHRGGFTADYVERRENKDANADDFDKERRLLAHFFHTLRAMMEERLIDRPVVARTFGASPFKFYLEVVEPLDRAHAGYFRPDERYDGGRDYIEGFLADMKCFPLDALAKGRFTRFRQWLRQLRPKRAPRA